jgi:hypothetical protein
VEPHNSIGVPGRDMNKPSNRGYCDYIRLQYDRVARGHPYFDEEMSVSFDNDENNGEEVESSRKSTEPTLSGPA